jgi:hypothetical protein
MRFEDEEHEPVAVVRVMADFALALTLIVLMLIGTRSPSAPPPEERTASRAATPQPGAKKADLSVALVGEGKFTMLPPAEGEVPMDGAILVQRWMKSHSSTLGSVVIQFPSKALAADLHRGLLSLQTALGTNNVTIQTIPAASK